MENKTLMRFADLAELTGPLSGLFEQPKSAEEWEQYMLTDEQVRSFERDGYVRGIKILTGAQVDLLNRELARSLLRGLRGTWMRSDLC